MASHQEFVVEWKMLNEDCNNWTSNDLHLAAELGRSLLERNEELENEVKSQQILIDDQSQEIEFLSKQVGTMKEENSNRSKFYEQLESSLFDLERTNQQLVQKSEFDKKRILSMCENIDYLERKCEELSGTLETIRDASKKRYHNGKYSHGTDYFSYTGSSDSSEEEVIYGGAFRKSQFRRAHSLQDLRDFTPSPYDEFDSSHSHSNSPDLKTSENEFIQTLESRVEELIQAKKKEGDKVMQLESQLRILIQENANLQQQLSHISLEKQEEINTLRKELLDTSSRVESRFYVPQPSETHNPVSRCDKSVSTALSSSAPDSNGLTRSSATRIKRSLSTEEQTDHICKRCAMEINVLNLVNSIEYENDDYSSLEFELARASESLSAESSSLSSIDNHNYSPVHTHPSPQYPNAPGNTFEAGFLDYFFGTNSILKKIHLKRIEEPSLKSESKDETDSTLLKDFGIEKYDKVFTDCSPERKSPAISSPLFSKKLQVPEKIPDESLKSNFDENILCDSAEVTVGVKNRSKLWWLVWFALMVLGTVQVLWQTARLLFWFILTTILPRSSSSSKLSSTAPPIRPSSIFPNSDIKTHCAYFPSSRLPTSKLPSASYT